MGKRDALGNAYPPLPPYRRIPVAGRTYCSRDTRRSRNRSKEDAGVYADFAENYMAMPVIKGVKSASERFAGALDTYTIEAMMQDGKALQAGTSHFLGQNFGKAFDVTFIDKNGKSDYAWATSWGFQPV